jgi:hypothetical protein
MDPQHCLLDTAAVNAYTIAGLQQGDVGTKPGSKAFRFELVAL